VTLDHAARTLGRDDKLDGFVTRAGRGSEDRAALAAFLDGDKEIARHEVGALRDASREKEKLAIQEDEPAEGAQLT
jgi:plasmid replication initiation protein